MAREHGTPNRTPDQLETEARRLLKKAKIMRNLQKVKDARVPMVKRVQESAEA